MLDAIYHVGFGVCDLRLVLFFLMRRFLVSVCHPRRLITNNKTPVLPRFNGADWIYLQLLTVGGCCTVIRLCYHSVYLLGLRINIYVTKYIERFNVVV